MLLFIAMTQAIASAPPQTIDLVIPKACEAQASDNADVVVCGRRGDDSTRYRIPPTTPYQANLPKAEVQFGNRTSTSAETEQFDVGGRPSNRIMIRLKVKF